jgi:hypothetical protein
VPPYEELKKQHKLLKANAIKVFKSKSLGENNDGYEDKINLAIADRFTHIKLVAETGYRKQVEEYLREDILAIEKKIKSNFFKKMIDFNQDLDAIK